jgi:hypothetical protein
MYTIILCAVIGLIIAVIFTKRGDREKSDYIFTAIVGPVYGGVAGMIIAGIVICGQVPMKNVVFGPIELVAMRSSDGASGTFVWGSGSISNQTTYNFLQRSEDGSMVPGSVPADGRVHLIEDPDLKDTGFWRTTFVTADTASPLYNWAIATGDRAYILRQEFRVPVGTVVQQFNID